MAPGESPAAREDAAIIGNANKNQRIVLFILHPEKFRHRQVAACSNIEVFGSVESLTGLLRTSGVV